MNGDENDSPGIDVYIGKNAYRGAGPQVQGEVLEAGSFDLARALRSGSPDYGEGCALSFIRG